MSRIEDLKVKSKVHRCMHLQLIAKETLCLCHVIASTIATMSTNFLVSRFLDASEGHVSDSLARQPISTDESTLRAYHRTKYLSQDISSSILDVSEILHDC